MGGYFPLQQLVGVGSKDISTPISIDIKKILKKF
jgi:hypothetical protein